MRPPRWPAFRFALTVPFVPSNRSTVASIPGCGRSAQCFCRHTPRPVGYAPRRVPRPCNRTSASDCESSSFQWFTPLSPAPGLKTCEGSGTTGYIRSPSQTKTEIGLGSPDGDLALNTIDGDVAARVGGDVLKLDLGDRAFAASLQTDGHGGRRRMQGINCEGDGLAVVLEFARGHRTPENTSGDRGCRRPCRSPFQGETKEWASALRLHRRQRTTGSRRRSCATTSSLYTSCQQTKRNVGGNWVDDSPATWKRKGPRWNAGQVT